MMQQNEDSNSGSTPAKWSRNLADGGQNGTAEKVD